MRTFLDRLVGCAVAAPERRPVRPRVRSYFEPPPAARVYGLPSQREPAALDEQPSSTPLPASDQALLHRTHTAEAGPKADGSVPAPPPAPRPPRTPAAEAPPSAERIVPVAAPPEPRTPSAQSPSRAERGVLVPSPQSSPRPAPPVALAAPLSPPSASTGAHRGPGGPRPLRSAPSAPAAAVPGQPRPRTPRTGSASSPTAAPARAVPAAAAKPDGSPATEPQLGSQPTHGILHPRAVGIATTAAMRSVAHRTPPASAAGPDGRMSVAAGQLTADRAAAEQPEHVVHVTIGRLEVRAETPPAVPAPKRPTRRSGIALDDYLRERSEGRRR